MKLKHIIAKAACFLVCTASMASPAAMAPDKSSLERITHWNSLEEPLVWVGETPPSESENQDLLIAMDGAQTNRWPVGLVAFEDYLSGHPQSPWAPSLRTVLAFQYYRNGHYSLALNHWEMVWAATKDANTGAAKRVADFTLAHWTRLLASLGRLETLTNIIAENRDRVLDRGPLSQQWGHTREAVSWMRQFPGISYRCGTLALYHAAEALQLDGQARPLLEVPSPSTGFTVQALSELSAKLGLGFVPMKRDTGEALVLPSVVHWKQNHYAAIVSRSGEWYKVEDPTFGSQRFMTAENINAEASGYFLVPSNRVPTGFRNVSADEAGAVFGRGFYLSFSDGNDLPTCPNGGDGGEPPPGQDGPAGTSRSSNNNPTPKSGCTGCETSSSGVPFGMPEWRISEPYLNLWLQDEPLGYQPALGPRVSLQVRYRQRYEAYAKQMGTVGPSWFCSWLSFVDAYNFFRYGNFDDFKVYLGEGGQLSYSNSQSVAANYYTSLKLWSQTNASGMLTNIALLYPNGGADNYGLMPTNGTQRYAYLTQKVSPEGYVTTFQYDCSDAAHIRLTNVVDACGASSTLNYVTNSDGSVLLSQVTDPFGRSAYFSYDPTSNVLTNIVDVANLTSHVVYDSGGTITNLTTPYGATSFSWSDASAPNGVVNRLNTITQTDGGVQEYAFLVTPPSVEPSSYTSSQVPTNDPINTLETTPQFFFTYHWDPRQYAALSTNNVNYMSSSDYLRARMRHWLGLQTDGSSAIDTLSIERDASPDGATFGQLTWYDYFGKPSISRQGYDILPDYIGRVLPDGSTQSRFTQRNPWRMPTNIVTSYTIASGAVALRTNVNVYASNGLDLVQAYGPDGVLLQSYAYNANHEVIGFTNAVGDWMTNGFNGNHQLTSMRSLSGLTTTNTYFASGSSVNWLQQTVDLEIGRTNSFTYANDLVSTKTDERGLVTTYLYDSLQRITNASDSRGAISYSYTNLDLVKVVDRMGFTTSYGYDPMRRKTAETNALNRYTLYNYCNCGALNSIRDAAGNYTYFYYDSAGRLVNKVYADGFGTTNNYNLLSQVTNTVDSAGMSLTNWFNNQGSLYAVSNAFGCVKDFTFDINDRTTNSIDANGVNVAMTYDNLGRMLTRSYPDGGVEKMGYSAAGLTAYTNQLGFTNFFAYDPASRKTFETNANWELTQFQYSPAGDLTNLTDGKLQSTKWSYDKFGHVTNKVDAANNTVFQYGYDLDDRLTNRWTPTKGTTVYRYDPAGNLTNVIYPINPSLVLGYDPLNRLTNMIDGVGSSYYSYDAAGQLLSEDGPWVDDTVSYVYTNRLRASLSLLQPNSSSWVQAYGYDAAKRFSSITSPAGTFNYQYPAGMQGVVGNLQLPNAANITNTYDTVARLLSTVLKNSTNGILNSHRYGYNVANQRTVLTNTAGDYRNFIYDPIGQLTNVFGREANYAARLNEYQAYSYDAAHNVKSHYIFNITENFGLNSLNELTNEWRSGSNFEVAGTTTSPATNVLLAVNGGIPYSLTPYNDNTWAVGASLLDGTNTFTAVARDNLGRSDTNTSSFYLPVTNTFSYDLNGNLLSDGNRNFSYDDENQLISVWVTNNWRSDFVYDGKMRRRIRFESSWNGSAWVTNTLVQYVYDGNVVIQERRFDPQVPTTLPQQAITYTRGRDLSGSLQSAGGIGGLLARSDSALVNAGSSFGHSFYHADGSGDITALIYQNQTIAAKYLYDAFGNILSKAGALADANLYRFSSKEIHQLSALIYYLYRFYDPNFQRWLNRDPIEEEGGINLYRFLSNDPIRSVDAWGTWGYPLPPGVCGPPSPCASNPDAGKPGYYQCGWISDPKTGFPCPIYCSGSRRPGWKLPPPPPPRNPCGDAANWGDCFACMTERGANAYQAADYCNRHFKQ